MGKKLFKFMKEAAAKPEKPGAAGMRGEEASRPADRMRDLIRSEYSPEQVAVLDRLRSDEGAARYSESPVELDNVVAPSDDMLKIISEQTGLRIANLSDYPRASLKLRGMITPEQAKTMRVVPVEQKKDGTIVVAIADPSNPTIADDLRLILGEEVETVIADEDDINDRIEEYYGMGESIEDIVSQETEETADENVLDTGGQEIDLSDMEKIAQAPPIIKLVNILLLRAINDRASDIHIEPFPNFIRIRYRVDGVLREIPSPPRHQLIAIISRIKVMAGMNISESRLPQDGRIKLSFESREVDMRVSSVPTVHGEAIVMRVLDKSMMMIGINNIGMLNEVLDQFKKVIRRPNGIVLVTGPTGCGKTTTLYATLAEVIDPTEKLITAEDPVEYEMQGLQQVNINEAAGLTFARTLRAMLRQDPDTVLVGEIRDVQTAQISVQAALTGHLVFSTLHTNSAAATVTRLLDMGVEPFLITSALEAVVGQRLIRTICQACKQPYTPNEDELLGFGITPEELADQEITFYHGEGCPECSHSGYHGRMGIFELMIVDDEIREMIMERATTDEIHAQAVRHGMITMRQDGWIKVCMGLTTMAEVARHTPKEVISDAPADETTESIQEQVETPEQLPEPGQQKLPEAEAQPSLNDETMQVKQEEAMPARNVAEEK